MALKFHPNSPFLSIHHLFLLILQHEYQELIFLLNYKYFGTLLLETQNQFYYLQDFSSIAPKLSNIIF
jgi:hypothetical protein